MKEVRRWAIPVAALATSGILFAAYSGHSSAQRNSAGNPAAAQDPYSAPDPYAAPSAAAAGGPTALRAVTDGKIGPIVVDGKGWTLYRFDKDTANPPASNCNGACATAWPPAPATGNVTLTGVDRSLVGSVKRADGTSQLTLGGWPLYRYAKDATPGDTNGQGVGGTWFAATPAGKKAGATKPNWSGWTVLKVVQDPRLGQIVVDAAGRTLYRFDKDSTHPSASNCNGACAALWPPIHFTKKLHLVGVARAEVGNIMRQDGTCQLTLGGWPLYKYAKDAAPGDTNGQGVARTWFATTPTGN
ncbi:MAG: putative lipoprotein [Actinomycetia bacterium]|nr:putative lipoprotein [Actinomycetes bacterium]